MAASDRIVISSKEKSKEVVLLISSVREMRFFLSFVLATLYVWFLFLYRKRGKEPGVGGILAESALLSENQKLSS